MMVHGSPPSTWFSMDGFPLVSFANRIGDASENHNHTSLYEFVAFGHLCHYLELVNDIAFLLASSTKFGIAE